MIDLADAYDCVEIRILGQAVKLPSDIIEGYERSKGEKLNVAFSFSRLSGERGGKARRRNGGGGISNGGALGQITTRGKD